MRTDRTEARDLELVLALADQVDDVTPRERRAREGVRALVEWNRMRPALAALNLENTGDQVLARHGIRCTCRNVAGRPARSADIDPACPLHIPTDPKDQR